ncbi:MAG TPA: response regulator [Terriglobales bacterium]|nr:response regulator [Terriglobales bacterium]
MSLLLVCNEPSFRVVLGDLLRGAGYEVDVCRDLDGANRQLQRTPYELIILNLFDEGETTLRACHELQSIRAQQKIAFIQGRWTAIPTETCPHYLLPLAENREELLARVAEIVEQGSPPPPKYTWELAGQSR